MTVGTLYLIRYIGVRDTVLRVRNMAFCACCFDENVGSREYRYNPRMKDTFSPDEMPLTLFGRRIDQKSLEPKKTTTQKKIVEDDSIPVTYPGISLQRKREIK